MLKTLCLIAAMLTSVAKGEPSCSAPNLCVPSSLCKNEEINQYGATNSGCTNSRVCCNPADIEVPETLPTPENACGSRPANGRGTQISSETYGDTHFAEFPWVVAILTKSDHTYLGGGSILAPKVVLTAAHVVYQSGKDNLIARAGEWDIQAESEPYSHADRFVIETIIHEDFNDKIARNDIALLVLDFDLTFSYHIMPICLPRNRELFQVQKCYVTGWGKEVYNGLENSNILQKVDLPIVNVHECQEFLRKTILGEHYELPDSYMCAGGEIGKDACGSDGGAPLVCAFTDMPHRYYQIGIVSFGLGCGQKHVPGAYTNVFALRNWIAEKLLQRNINPEFYTPPKTTAYNEYNFLKSDSKK